jgi:FKBP-type peptidyl-prolyl cis-trans isomerase FkpA
MRKTIAMLGVAMLPAVFVGCSSGTAGKAPVTDEEKTVYAVGLTLSQNIDPLHLTPAEVEIVKQAMSDAAAGKPAVKIEEWGPKIGELARAREGKAAGAEKDKAQAYQAKAAAEPGAVKTASGLIYKELTAGTGAMPAATDNVQVNYKGTLIDGTEFDSSAKHGGPADLLLNRVIPCWTEGVQKMKAGGKAQLVCPSEIAYGDGGSPPTIPGGATLVFEVELLKILKPDDKKK